MSIKEVIEQLETLVEHCDKCRNTATMNREPWCDDVRALNIAIDILKRYDKALNIIEEYSNGKK